MLELYLFLAQYHKSKFWELLEILDKSQYFKNWPNELRNVIALHLKLRTLSRNTVLYKENDKIESIYLIKSGEVEVNLLFKKKIKKYFSNKIDFLLINLKKRYQKL